MRPSTVHRRIGQLEEELESRLFDRHPRGFSLTLAGTTLMPTAEALEQTVEAGRRRMLGHDSSPTGNVRIAAAEDVASYLLVGALVTLREEYPGIHYDITIGNERLSLTRGETDIAVRIGSNPDDENLVPHHVGDVAVGFYAARAYLRSRGEPRRISDLSNHALVLPNHGFEEMERLGLPPGAVSTSYRSNSFAHLGRATAAGFGVGLLPAFVGAQLDDVERLFPIAGSEASGLWLLVHHEVRRAARVQATIEVLRRELEAQSELFLDKPQRRKRRSSPVL